MTKEHQLQIFQLKQQTGLNINNFVNTFDYDVVMIKQKTLLYLSYLEFFHNIHTKHFKRFSKKMKLMHDHLDEDIKFDEGIHQSNEDDSMKSTISTYSFDFEEELITTSQNTPNVSNSNSNNITLSFNEIDFNNKENANVLTNSFNTPSSDINPSDIMPDDKEEVEVDADDKEEVEVDADDKEEDADDKEAVEVDADDKEDTDEPNPDKTDKKKRKRNKKKK